jgi:alkylhydroperoxidase/carboxymuconolactone decarboxylase family protein YurZ
MTLSPTERTLARLSVAIALGNWQELRELRLAAPAGEPDRRWREAVLQAHLFAGFPRVVEACGVLEEHGGLGAPDADEARTDGDRFPEGRALFDRVYGGKAGGVRAALEGYHPVLARWIEGHAYGRVLARGGLSAAQRELFAVACLAALGQERQLASHARGAVHVGASARALRETLDAVVDLVDAETLRRSHKVLDRFAPLA